MDDCTYFMDTLTDQQCVHWLQAARIPIDPYSSLSEPIPFGRPVPFFEQVDLPSHRSPVFHQLIRSVPFESVLLHCTNWDLHYPGEIEVIEAIRKSAGERRMLKETPGHLFGKGEEDLLAGMLAIMKYFAWSAYLYFDNATTLYCWEGEIFDLWAYEEESFMKVKEVFSRCELRPVSSDDESRELST